MRIVTLTICAALVLTMAAGAQVAYTLEDTGTSSGGAARIYQPSAGYTTGGQDPRGPMDLPEYSDLPPAGGIAADVGGMCIDQGRSLIFSCNGFYAQCEGMAIYDAPAVDSSVGIGVYFDSGQITGMALRVAQPAGPAGQPAATPATLFCVDNKQLRSFDVSTTTGSTTAVNWTPNQGILSPIQLSWLNNDDNLTGLGYESSTGNLWACASNGNIFRMDTNGNPVGVQPVTNCASAGTLSGLAVNTSNGVASWPAPVQSFQVSGFHILVTDGQNVYDAMNALAAPIACGGTGTARGLSFSSDGQLIPASSSCPQSGTWIGNPNISTGNGPGIRTTQPACPGNVNNLELLGGPVNSNARLLFDFAPIENGAPMPTGDVLYIWPLSPTAVISGFYGTNNIGEASVAIPIGAAPVGIQFSYQWYFHDPSNPPLYGCFSDAMTVTVGAR